MLASSVAAPAVTRFGKKAQGVSARKAISRVPVGGHKVQVRLLSTSSPDFHPLLDATAAGACAAPFVPPAPEGRSRVVLTPSSSPHRVPGGSTRAWRRAARTPRVARTPSPVSISRYVISDKFLGTDGIPRAHRAPEAHTRPDNNDTN